MLNNFMDIFYERRGDVFYFIGVASPGSWNVMQFIIGEEGFIFFM